MSSKNTSMNFQEGDTITNKKRGDILSYSVSQVAALLDQEDSNILYFTNIFDNILQIEIADKELTYTNKDIDKLEFLIKLKNKGLTTKEIQKYFENLPLDIEDLMESKNHNSTSTDGVSVNEIIETISKSENEKLDKLKEYLSNKIVESNELFAQKIEESNKLIVQKIDENNELLTQKIMKVIGEEQGKQLKSFKDDILNEIKELINSKSDVENVSDTSLYHEMSIKLDDLTSEKLSLEGKIKSQFDKFNELSISRENKLIDEFKKYANIMDQAYAIQKDMDTHKEKTSFISRIFLDNDK